jgi:hypothetical protein
MREGDNDNHHHGIDGECLGVNCKVSEGKEEYLLGDAVRLQITLVKLFWLCAMVISTNVSDTLTSGGEVAMH